MKSICFEGIDCEDLIMHLAKLLVLSGRDAVIADENGSYSYSEIPVIRGTVPEGFEGTVLRNGGDEEKGLKCLVTDLQPLNARRLEKKAAKNSPYDLVIIRDMRGDEKDGDYIMNLLKIRGRWIGIRENEKDRAVRCCLQEGIGYRLGKLSKGMLKGITEAASILTDLSAREARKAVGREKNGQDPGICRGTKKRR